MLLGVGTSSEEFAKSFGKERDATAKEDSRTEAKVSRSLLTSRARTFRGEPSARAWKCQGKADAHPPAQAMRLKLSSHGRKWRWTDLELHIRSDYAPPASSARTKFGGQDQKCDWSLLA